jgi:cytochrome c-type biogenesis protein CcmH/NrfG
MCLVFAYLRQNVRASKIVTQKRLAIVSVLSLLLSTNTFAHDAPVTDCDAYAASAGDPQRKANGVPLDEINPDLAVPACEAAVRQYPDSSRLIYQLGRAYQKANNFDAALVQYRKAADQGFAPLPPIGVGQGQAEKIFN